MFKFESQSAHESGQIATSIKQVLDDNSVQYVLLIGEMGAGKTTLVKDILREYGSCDIAVSPTFSVHNTYAASDGTIILHSDLYRIDSMTELEQTGFFELAESAQRTFIEWGNKLGLKDMLETYAEIRIIKRGPSAREYTLKVTDRRATLK